MAWGWGTSRLLDVRDCARPEWQAINHRLVGLESRLQPYWFKPLFRLDPIYRRLGYGHWSRLWEYPWAILSANLKRGMRVLDIGSGGSAFPIFLAVEGCEVYAADPTLDTGSEKASWRYTMTRRLGIASFWGLPPRPSSAGVPITYVPDSIQTLRYDDGYFDRVFCLSVMEHIPEDQWPECMAHMSRVLSRHGRVILTLDMGAADASERQYRKLLVEPSLSLVGDVDYAVPITVDDRRSRHPGHTYETLGMVWDKE